MNTFINSNTSDVIIYNGKKILRPMARDIVFNTKDSTLKEYIASHPKEPFEDSKIITKQMKSPFETLNIETKSLVQEFVISHIPLFPIYQAFLYTASCGSGKTLAGLYAIYALRCKTLIISCRNAINEQWKNSINQCFPNLKVQTRENSSIQDENADIYIYSPQYVAKRFTDMNLNVSLIIYDEIHSLISDVFYKVLEGPFKMVNNEKWKQLPYFIGLSATLPAKNSKERTKIENVFGKPFSPSSIITSIPIHVWDYRNTIEEKQRGTVDAYYDPPDDYEIIAYFVNKINNEKLISPSPKFKGMVITYTIDSSIWAGLYMHKVWKVNILIIRAAGQKCLFLDKDIGTDLSIPDPADATLPKITKNIHKYGRMCYLEEGIDDAAILCGCFHRLKEGFSVENCVWGIITKFVWSLESRVQMLGRIRRMSKNRDILNAHRMFYVCSGKIPSNLYMLSKKLRKPFWQVINDAKIEYNTNIERKVFSKENIIMDN